MKSIPAIIHATLAVGASATAPYYDVNISQVLCVPACEGETPVFSPSFSVQSIEEVGTNQYLVHVHVEGVISYVPCHCGCCQTKSQVVSQNFVVPVFSAARIESATIEAGTTLNDIVKKPCQLCSSDFVSDTPITINLVTA